MTTVLIVGTGNLGGWVLELLARVDGVDAVVTMSRRPDPEVSRMTLAAVGSTLQGHSKVFDHLVKDLNDVDGTASLLDRVKPDLIVNTSTVKSPRALAQAELAPSIRAKVERTRFGMWLPWQLLPATRLVEAIQKTGQDRPVINAAFPDVVNPALWRRFGWGPIVGAGNIEILVASITRLIAADNHLPVEDVDVSVVGSHALFVSGARPEIPWYFDASVRGTDITNAYDFGELLQRAGTEAWRHVKVSSAFAASIVKNITGLLSQKPTRSTVTAPNGLPGGYPAALSTVGIELTLPEALSLEDAIAINVLGNRFDGVDEIGADGTITFTEDLRESMSELGFECATLPFDALENRSTELLQVYDRLLSAQE
jgi:hypothetical protein